MEDVSVKISSGLGMINKEDKLTDEAFILDCDYFKVGKVELSEIDSIGTKLHQKSTTFFRNSISCFKYVISFCICCIVSGDVSGGGNFIFGLFSLAYPSENSSPAILFFLKCCTILSICP